MNDKHNDYKQLKKKSIMNTSGLEELFIRKQNPKMSVFQSMVKVPSLASLLSTSIFGLTFQKYKEHKI